MILTIVIGLICVIFIFVLGVMLRYCFGRVYPRTWFDNVLIALMCLLYPGVRCRVEWDSKGAEWVSKAYRAGLVANGASDFRASLAAAQAIQAVRMTNVSR